MGEVETESIQTGDANGPEEGLEPTETLSEDEDDPEDVAEPDGQQEPAEEPLGISEKEVEARFKRIEGRATTWRNAVSEVLGEIAQSYRLCPLCGDSVPGFIPEGQPPDEVIAATRAVIGLPDLSHYEQAQNAHRCGNCGGQGVVLSGSLVKGNEAIQCTFCNGSGYLVVPGEGQPSTAPVAAVHNGEAPLLPGVNPDDPAVAELRARGWFVAPPAEITAG